jgi:hypothetical protein
VKKAKKKLARDRAALARARSAYRACMNRAAAPAPAPAPEPAPTPNPVTEQCLAAAGQITGQDSTGTLSSGAGAFCDALGEATATSGGDPVTVCEQLAANDPTGQLGQLCTALDPAALPGTGLPSTGLPGLPI